MIFLLVLTRIIIFPAMKKIFFTFAVAGLLFAFAGCSATNTEGDTLEVDEGGAVNSATRVVTNTNVNTVNTNIAKVNTNTSAAENVNTNTNAAGNSNVNAAADDEDEAEPNPTDDNEVNLDGEVQIKVGEVTADSAKFVFSQAVRDDEIDSAHIEHCIVSLSAVAVENNEDPDCTAATAAAGFSLDFDADSQSLVITNTTDAWGVDGGPFQVGCASCVSAVRFTGLYTETGDLVKTTLVEVQ